MRDLHAIRNGLTKPAPGKLWCGEDDCEKTIEFHTYAEKIARKCKLCPKFAQTGPPKHILHPTTDAYLQLYHVELGNPDIIRRWYDVGFLGFRDAERLGVIKRNGY